MGQLEQCDCQTLLDLARASIAATVIRAPLPTLETEAVTPPLAERSAAFVTLREEGELRGCIGMLRYDVPLWVNVRDSAAAAARDDYRFMPVRADEVPLLSLEVSVLEPPRRIADASEFVAGKHGIMVERGMCRGLLLPQVAGEMGWDERQMLSAVCRKADLPASAWAEPSAHLYVFEAFCFGDDETQVP